MSILVNKNTRLIVQGITGQAGAFHTKQCKEYGTNVVGGVTPGKGGQNLDGIPIFDSVKEAVKKTQANTTMIYVPAPFAADAILEAAEAGIGVIICIAEGIPVIDMIAVKEYLRHSKSILVGPNCPELSLPDSAKSELCLAIFTKPVMSAWFPAAAP
jgi:succinyl-CoA synthetase alpha subunit